MKYKFPKPGIMEVDGTLLYLEMVNEWMATLTAVDRVVTSFKSEAGQLIEIVDSPFLGRSLYIDHVTMFSLGDEFIYHETLIHPALLTLDNPEKVLVIGGGDGGALREILKHPVKEVTLVELDKSVIELVKEHLPEMPQGAFEDPRVKLVFNDGRAYVETTEEKYDVVVLDVTDPKGQAARLYTKEFYEAVRGILREGGLAVTHSEGLTNNRVAFLRIFRAMGEAFPKVTMAKAYVPSFSDEWTFTFGGLSTLPDQLSLEDLERRFRERGLEGKTKFYSPRMHYSLFLRPVFLEEELKKEVEPSTDQNPVTVP